MKILRYGKVPQKMIGKHIVDINEIIMEAAMQRKAAIENVGRYGLAVEIHLAKVALGRDQQEYQHWLKELSIFLFNMVDVRIKPKNKPIDPNIIRHQLLDLTYPELDDFLRFVQNRFNDLPYRDEDIPVAFQKIKRFIRAFLETLDKKGLKNKEDIQRLIARHFN